MIVDNTYFKNEIYIPNATPSVAGSVAGVGSNVIDFINKYEAECLRLCLGPLYIELLDNIDENGPSLIKQSSDIKWDELVNGKEYICPTTGDIRIWRGIRFKDSGSDHFRSFISYYIYFFHERSNYETRSMTGTQVENPANARSVVPTNKLVNSWNNFVELVQGSNYPPVIYGKGELLGVDYYNSNKDWLVSLYQFIRDSNFDSETYKNFLPKRWNSINVFGV